MEQQMQSDVAREYSLFREVQPGHDGLGVQSKRWRSEG